MNEKPMAKEWGISYAPNFGGMQSEEIWMTFDTEEQARKGMEHLRESERRGQLASLRLHVRHVTEWEQSMSDMHDPLDRAYYAMLDAAVAMEKEHGF